MLAQPARAIDALTLQLGHLVRGGWSAQSVQLRLGLAAGGHLALDVEARGVQGPGRAPPVTSIELHCPQARLTQSAFHCDALELRLSADQRSLVADGGALDVQHHDGAVDFKLAHLKLAGGTFDLSGDWSASGWRAQARTSAVELSRIGGLLDVFARIPERFSAGRVAMSAELAGGQAITSAAVHAQLRDAAFTDPSGLHAGEHVGAEFQGSLAKAQDAWKLQGSLAFTAGQLYLDPVYLAATAKEPLRMEMAGAWAPGSGRLELQHYALVQPGVADISGQGRLVVGHGLQIERLRVDRGSIALAPFFHAYGQLLDTLTSSEGLQAGGRLEFDGEWNAAAGGSAHLHLDDVSLRGANDSFGISGLGGEVAWRSAGEPAESHLSWQQAKLYRIKLGAAALAGYARGRGFRLSQPLIQPLLGGALHIDGFAISGLGSPQARWEFKGLLDGMSMKALSGALGWPEFAGTLSGVVPAVRYAHGILRMDGALSVQVFDGFVVVRDLRLDHPLAPSPVLDANISINSISLGALTQVFSFGKIQGRLDGYVHDLVLVDWRPQSFDAKFATAENDNSPHRISQRAVNNLASLGGAGGVLSSTLLRFFNEFSYSRLGISCRLHDGVCAMGGVAPAEQGYYIVQGAGIPSINVIGFNREVDWDTLLRRLKSAIGAAGPVVK